MLGYAAPVEDILAAVALAGGEPASAASADVLLAAARFAEQVLAPLNRVGDEAGAQWRDGLVATPPGFRDAYGQFVAAGWPTLAGRAEYGGQAQPFLTATAVNEMWAAANLAFSLCPLANESAAEMLYRFGSEALRRDYLPKLVTGEWTGPMCLTEPQAGTDLGAIRARATKVGDAYRVRGSKMFITYGEHDYTDNIIYFVLARLDGAPAGSAGLSLFLVPKILPPAGRQPGARNDVRCVSIERKLGIHASPTAALTFGEGGEGAVGWLIGRENRGLEAMFSMMNRMRLGVGIEAVAIAERAYQLARAYARARLQGTLRGQRDGPSVAIIRHPDVRRMLLMVRAQTEAMRGLAYYAAACIDRAAGDSDAAAQARADLLTPIVKGWTAEIAVEAVSNALQVHGGAGYIEESGAAQLYRDARVLSIYEATTGIQALDLVNRKLARDDGRAFAEWLGEMRETARQASGTDDVALAEMARRFGPAVQSLADAGRDILQQTGGDPDRAAAVSVPFLMLAGTVAGAWAMMRAATAGAGEASPFRRAKTMTALFYSEHVLPRAAAYADEVRHGGSSTLDFDEAAF